MDYNQTIGHEVLLYYDIRKNMMIDDDGFAVFDIFRYISPNELHLFKYYREDMSVRCNDGSGRQVILLYPRDGNWFDLFN